MEEKTMNRTKITARWLKKMGACSSKEDNKRAEKIGDVRGVVKELLKSNRFNDAVWLITRKLDRMECIRYALYCAKKVLPMFEEKYPDDNRPREAVRAAQAYLKNPSEKNQERCRKAAANATNAANYAADAADAANAAYYAANAAYYAANVNTANVNTANVNTANVNTANVNTAAYYAANAAYYAANVVSGDRIKRQIANYGLKLLYKGETNDKT
jgi:hypothetical protein